MINLKPPFLSICIPAFGRVEYLRNTLNSIYSEKNLVNISLDDFEVIISDNDPAKAIEILLTEFQYSNIYYYSTLCEGFMNSFHVLNYAKGIFFKLHNSQELWNPGSLKSIIDIAKFNKTTKPFVFLTSGLLMNGEVSNFNNFDSYMCNLSYLSSWSNGFCIWKTDFDKVRNSLSLNNLFPHTSIFLSQHHKSNFIINDKHFFSTQFVNKRGGHNKFHAFSIEYPALIDGAYKNGFIKLETRNKIINDILIFYLPLLFFNVKIAKRETFDSTGFRKNLRMYFPKGAYFLVNFLSIVIPFKVMWRKIKLKYILKSEF